MILPLNKCINLLQKTFDNTTEACQEVLDTWTTMTHGRILPSVWLNTKNILGKPSTPPDTREQEKTFINAFHNHMANIYFSLERVKEADEADRGDISILIEYCKVALIIQHILDWFWSTGKCISFHPGAKGDLNALHCTSNGQCSTVDDQPGSPDEKNILTLEIIQQHTS